MNALDRDWMSLALEAANDGTAEVYPNPRVGAVVVKKGKLIGRGAHLKAGEAHAEVHALKDCKDAQGATIYVTLEPCAHRGKTPPCAELILKSGIERVVYGLSDPGPGQGGAQVLKEAGLQVDGPMMDLPGLIEVLEPFCKNALLGETYFIQKWAMTLDGKISTSTGDSKWITNEKSRKHSHQIRSYVDGILVGAGTVSADLPKLTVRHEYKGPDPRPIVWDPEGRTKGLKDWWSGMKNRLPLVFSKSQKEWPDGVQVLPCPNLKELPKVLFLNGIHCVLVEGGAGVHGLLNDAKLGDRILAYIAPKWVGGAKASSPIAGTGLQKMDEALTLIRQELRYFDGDVLLEGLTKVHHPEYTIN